MITEFLVFKNLKHYEALIELENHLTLAKKSKVTINCYVSMISRVINAFNRLPEECTKSELIKFILKHKNAKGYQYSTLKNFVSALRYYFIHIVEDKAFAYKIPFPKIKDYDIEVLTIEDMRCLFAACKDSRQKLLVQILYETGIRLSELANLKLHHIDFNLKTISIINGKHNKTRTVGFGASLEKTIRKYLNDFPTLFDNTLFTNKLHPILPLSSRGIQWNLKYISKNTNIRKKISPHILRHTFAVHYLNFGGTLYHLQRILGHVRMRTTLNYLQYSSIPEWKKVSVLDTLNSIE